MSRLLRLAVTLTVLTVIAGACSDDGDSDVTAPTTTTVTSAGSDGDGGAVDGEDGSSDDAAPDDGAGTDDQLAVPSSTVTATLAAYSDNAEATLGIADGEVTGSWYAGADGFRVAIFAGLTPAQWSSVCPGGSINDGTGFAHIANATTGGTACEGFTTLVGGDVKAYDCGGSLAFRSAIPNGATGELYLSLETISDGGDFEGLTGTATAGGEPSFDIAGCTPLA